MFFYCQFVYVFLYFRLNMWGFPAMFLYRNKYQITRNAIHIMLEFAMDWYVSSHVLSCFVSSVLLTIAYCQDSSPKRMSNLMRPGAFFEQEGGQFRTQVSWSRTTLPKKLATKAPEDRPGPKREWIIFHALIFRIDVGFTSLFFSLMERSSLA